MLRNTLRIAAVAAVLALSAPTLAQQGQVPPGSRFGLGVRLPTEQAVLISSLGAVGLDTPVAPSLYFPINLTPAFRIEPQIGRIAMKLDAAGGKGAVTSLGIGVFWVRPLAPQVQLYLGPRLVSSWRSSTDPGPSPDKTKGRDTILAAAVGGEYLPHPRFAVGAEGQLGFVGVGDTETTDGVTGEKFESPGGSATMTQGVLFVRVFLY